MGIDEQYEAWLEGEAAAAQAEAENERNKPNLASTSTVLIRQELKDFLGFSKDYEPPDGQINYNFSQLVKVARKQDAHTRHQIAEWLEKYKESIHLGEGESDDRVSIPVNEFNDFLNKLKE